MAVGQLRPAVRQQRAAGLARIGDHGLAGLAAKKSLHVAFRENGAEVSNFKSLTGIGQTEPFA